MKTMARGRGKSSNIPARDGGKSSVAPLKGAEKEQKVIVRQPKRIVYELVASFSYLCRTTKLEIQRLLRYCRLTGKHYKYEFNVLEGTCHLNEVFGPDYSGERPGFYLLLHFLEAEFTLFFPDFM
ncbi:hypothetical protein J1N35_012051 [Gossypium stocksii]|uniref:Uncharacterized protein n=1 Tax=Gossypium stocksii TaxID=47602 RepID=A0A9D4ADZ2_9ROSI|nr:hypothetical protein J1N35_012051 [Gossypium stocksii]